MPSCASSRARTYGLLLRRHFPNVAWRRPVWPDVGPGHSENGWTWPGVAPCLWSLAPIEPGLPDDAAERLAPLIGRRTALAAAGVPQASTFCQLFFRWYNHEHRHSGIGYHTPHDVHYGYASAIRAGRAAVLDAAHAPIQVSSPANTPAAPLPAAAWINKPEDPLNPTQ